PRPVDRREREHVALPAVPKRSKPGGSVLSLQKRAHCRLLALRAILVAGRLFARPTLFPQVAHIPEIGAELLAVLRVTPQHRTRSRHDAAARFADVRAGRVLYASMIGERFPEHLASQHPPHHLPAANEASSGRLNAP